MIMNKNYIRLGVLFVLLCSPAFVLMIIFGPTGVGHDYYLRVFKSFCFNVAICFFVPCALATFPRKLNLTLLTALLVLVVFYWALLSFHWLAYQQLIGTQSIRALMDTDVRESYEFYTLHQKTILYSVIPTIISVWFSWHIFKQAKLHAGTNAGHKLRNVILITVIGLSYLSYDREAFLFSNPVAFTIRASYDVTQDRETYKKYVDMKSEPSGAVLIDEAKIATKAHIVIIGESVTSKHMSLYGYERDTNPLMKLKRRLDRYQMGDVCSDAPLTQSSLEHIMLGNEKLNLENNVAPPNIMTILKEVGYKTFWLSNQSGGEGVVALSSIWGNFADYSELLSKRDFDVGYDFDEILLPAVKRALEDSGSSKVIFVHLIGSHPDYKLRYPVAYNHWGPDSTIPDSVKRKNEADFRKDIYNEYDNSILYTDFVVSSILDMADYHRVASVTYFSDHGQNVGEISPHIGHSFNGLKQGYEVPLLFWIDSKQLNYAHLNYAAMKQNLNKPFSLERLQYSLFDLFGLKRQLDWERESIFSEHYQIKNRVCDSIKND